MELLLISENKIRISLTKEDLDGYSITCDKIDYDNTETRRVFWCLFDDVKQKTGFDAAESRIFIQIYPDKNGGCELYVSKINAPASDNIGDGLAQVSLISEKAEHLSRQELYSFDGIEPLLSACRQLVALGYVGSSSAYADKRGRFYLLTEGDTKKTCFLTEYGLRHTSKSVRLYINEHCSSVCADKAVETLGTL